MNEVRETVEGETHFDYSYTYDEDDYLKTISGKRLRSCVYEYYHYEYTYDQDGNQIEGIRYDENLEIISSYKADYDENGNLIKGINYLDSVPTSKYEADYDENDNLISERRYTGYTYKGENKFQLEYELSYAYDQDSNLIEETRYNEYSEAEYKYIYHYDENGNVTEAENTDGTGQFVSRYRAVFKDNEIIEFSVTDSHGEVQTRHKAEYVNGNMVLEIDCTIPEKTRKISEAEYDDNGNQTVEINYEEEIGGEIFTSKKEYIYDKRDNCIEETYSVFYPENDEWRPLSKQTITIKYF